MFTLLSSNSHSSVFILQRLVLPEWDCEAPCGYPLVGGMRSSRFDWIGLSVVYSFFARRLGKMMSYWSCMVVEWLFRLAIEIHEGKENQKVIELKITLS